MLFSSLPLCCAPEVAGPCKEECFDNETATCAPMSMQEEKAQLRELIAFFVRQAINGCICVHVDETTREQRIARYSLDSGIKRLAIDSIDGVIEAACFLTQVVGVHSVIEDGESIFPYAVLESLRPEQVELLLMICYDSSAGGEKRLLLLSESQESCRMFTRCLQVISYYSREIDQQGETRLRVGRTLV